MLRRRYSNKRPERHWARDPEQVAGPELQSLLQWLGFWRGELRSVAEPDKLRQQLRALDGRVSSMYGTSFCKRMRPGYICSNLEEYFKALESRLRPASVLSVVGNDQLLKVCLAFMGAGTVGAACCANRRLKVLAESEDVWHHFLSAHFPASHSLCRGRSSRACYAYRVHLAREAAQRDEDRDHIGVFDDGHDDQWLLEEVTRYQLLVEMVVENKVFLCGTFDLCYDPGRLDVCVLIPGGANFSMTREECESKLRVSLTLLRKEDGKCLVIGDCMEVLILDDGKMVGSGSSPITCSMDKALYVLSQHPICNLCLRDRDEYWFCHEVSALPLYRPADGCVVGVSRISVSLQGVCDLERPDRMFPKVVLATWDELAPWV